MPKITSLSEQLKRLQVPQTNILSSINDRRRVSFLYDPKEAANLDSEAVYSIAMNGLEQLKSIDRETFESFELTLFNATSVTFERGIQTKQVNEKLNDEIRRFLLHLSPYFMLKPAHKAFEWLVYRYQIHNYNIDDLFMCILPYHETNYFVRALQMVDFEKNQFSNVQLWSWLIDNQKQGVQLSSSTLATRVFSDLSFLNFLIDYLNESVKHFGDEDASLQSDLQQKHWMHGLNFVFSFLTKILLQSIKNLSLVSNQTDQSSKKNQNNKQQEGFFALLLPVLFNGFKSEFIPYKQTSYLVVSFLFEKFRFTIETSNKALFAITKGLSQFRSYHKIDENSNQTSQVYEAETIDCIKSAILSICLIVQSQYDENSQNGQNELMSKNFLKKLLKNFSSSEQLDLLLNTIDNLNENYRIDKFLKCFLNRLLTESIEYDKETNDSSKINLDLDANDDLDALKDQDTNQYFILLLKLTNLLNLNRMPNLIDMLIRNMFNQLVSVSNQTGMSNLYIQYHLCELVFKFECKYPIQFDSCLNKFLQQDNINKNDKRNFLNVISCKFSSLKCKSTFKYQQLKPSGVDSELSLLLSLNHSNPMIRSNGFSYILTELKNKSLPINLDVDFIKSQLESKLRNESSPIVYEQILKFGAKLLDYFSLEQLIEDEKFLLKLFTIEIFSKRVDLEDNSSEMKEYKLTQNKEWLSCRETALELIFNDLYKMFSDKNEMFFNTLLIITSRLFELNSISLFEKLKTTQFYKKIQSETHNDHNGGTPVKKSFYSSTSSITISKIENGSKTNGYHTSDDEGSGELNDMFESFLQISVKYLLSNENKLNNNFVKEPKCFVKLAELIAKKEKRKINLSDLTIFEMCVRLCAQSLFLTNSAYYLNLAVDILTNLVGVDSVYSLKIKKSKSDTVDSDNKKLNTYSNYYQITVRQAIKNVSVLLNQFTNLFKSISIQISNFVNKNSKIEIENILNKIYIHLCSQIPENSYFSVIMNKFMNSSCFSITQSPTQTPTKHSATSNSSVYSFYQFIFKFLINSDELDSTNDSNLVLAQRQTIYLYTHNLNDFLLANKKTDDYLLNSIILVLSWCLTGSNSNVRAESLYLLEQISSKLDDIENNVWKSYLKKLLKHRKEIEIDGTDYVRTKSLNKILQNDDSNLIDIISHFLELSLIKNKSTFKYSQYSQFMSIQDLDLDSGCLILTKFKYCLLSLFKGLKDDLKIKFLDVLFNLLINNLNESNNLLTGQLDQSLIELNKLIITIISNNYLITKKSAEFFNKNEKYFDYLIGYLNNQNQSNETQFIRHLKSCLMDKLSAENEKLKFFQQLEPKMQHDLVKCLFNMWLFNSSGSFETSLNTSDSIQENISYLESIKKSLLEFDLTSAHFICLFNDKANLFIVNTKAEDSSINTTKEMKKQLNSTQNQKQRKQVDWRSLKLTLELIQSSLIKKENKMETDEISEKDNQDFIDLIPYLFLILETIETKFLIEVSLKQENEIDETHDFLYYEIMCLNSLLSIYKLNKLTNKSKLDQSKFNIELLMQILQTKKDSQDSAELNSSLNDNRTDRLNVQQHILILLSEIASIFPEKVLEHVLIMFVFVGNKLARKDDSYSFQIISQVIKSILPSIVDSVNSSTSKEQSESTEIATCGSNRLVKTVNVIKRHEKQLPYVSSLVCKILQSFVVALPHIPAHRKAIIFEQLMDIIGLNDYLWITIIQSIDHFLVQSHDLLDFTQNLEEFTNKQQQLLARNTNLNNGQESNVSKNEKKLRDTLKSCINSMIALHIQFESTKIVQSSIYLIAFLNKYLTSLFEHALKIFNGQAKNDENRKQTYTHLACQLDTYNLLQMKYLAYNLLTFVSELLVSEELVSKFAVLYEDQKLSNDSEYSGLFQNLLEKILVLILKLSQVFGSFDQQVSGKSGSNLTLVEDIKKFHKAILNKSYDLMEKTINLLDSKQFITVIKSLINHDLIQIRRRALVLLNNKLRKNEPSEHEVTLLITMIDDLLGSIQLDQTNESRINEANPVDIEINNQTILFSIKLLCKRIGEQNPLAFVKVLKFLSDNLIDRQLYIKSKAQDESISNSNLLSSVLLCIGEVCLKLKSNSLTYLNQIMTFTLEIVDFIRKKVGDLENSTDNDLVEDYNKLIGQSVNGSKSSFVPFKNYELLAISCVTCLLKVVQHMSNFLSPYLQRLFYISCSLSYLVSADQSSEGEIKQTSLAPHIELKLSQLRFSLAKQIPLRLLAPILSEQSSLITSVNEEKESSSCKMKIKHVEYYMQITRLAIQNSNQEDLISNIRTLRTMFMNLFDLRAHYIKINKSLFSSKKSSKKKQISLEGYLTKELSKYEDHAINAFCELTFKLSEDLFKPMFFKMYEWSTSNNPPKDRLITFYRTTYKLSDKLKNLFVLFAPQFVQNASDILNQINSSKTDEKFFTGSSINEKENSLLYSIVDTLSNVFLNDAQRTFVNKERFNLLMEPLVDQIENEIEFDDYKSYINLHLGPCIANLASCCVNEDALLRKFNYQILLKTKHNSVQVRLATLDVLNMFSKKVGDIYNSYLSETVPFLAELMEDPVEEVEDKVQFLIKELEDTLGESLQSHFV